MFIIKIGEPYSEKFRVVGYVPTLKMGVEYLRSLGYNHRNKEYGYYEEKPGMRLHRGAWARVEEVKPLFIEKLMED